MFKRLLSHLSLKRRQQLILLLILSFFASVAEVISVWSVIPFLNVLTNPTKLYNSNYIQFFVKYLNIDKPDNLLLPITIFFCMVMIFTGFVRIALIWVQTKLGHAIGADLSFKIYRNTLYQPYSVQISKNSSEIISGISNKSGALVSLAIMPVFTIISSFLIFLMIFIALVILNPLISFVIVIGFGLFYFIIFQFAKKTATINGEILNRELTSVVKSIQEGLGGIRDVLIDGSQHVYCTIFQNADKAARKASANITIISQTPRYSIETLVMILIAVVAYFLTKGKNTNDDVTILLGGFAMGALRIMPVLQQFYTSLTSLKAGKTPCLDALELLDQELPEYLNNKINIPLAFDNDFELKDVSFKYNSNAPDILKNLTLNIKKGKRIGIIGSTGSGKSTLLDVIMGLLVPTSGNLYVDQNIVTKSNYRNWQLLISHVPQTIFLADTTIAENIAFGVPKNLIDINRVEMAAKKAKIFDTINLMNDKFNSNVGERGVRLSGGQRQRIGIARALYKNTKILIFDEATSALDTITESEIMESIYSLDKELTLIIVAHRKSTLINCDEIIEIEEGKIKNISSYKELISSQ
jgi:ABC-type multidrug transport system fused ATPase/permease subunit